MPGKRLNPIGYSIDSPKLKRVSFNSIIWVLLYTAQKQDRKYQKKSINNKLININIPNFIYMHLLIYIEILTVIFIFFSCFILKHIFFR